MDDEKLVKFLEELVVEIGGKESLELLRELSDIGANLLKMINKQEPIPVESVERWNEIVKELYQKE